MTVENTSASQIAPVRQDRIRNPFSFFCSIIFSPPCIQFHALLRFQIRVIFQTLPDSSYMYLYRMWVCLRLVSPYFIHQLLFCKCSAWRSCKLYKSRNSFFRQNKTFLISCNRHCIIIKLC